MTEIHVRPSYQKVRNLFKISRPASSRNDPETHVLIRMYIKDTRDI